MNFKNKIEPYLISDDPILQEFVSHAIHDYPNMEEGWIEQLLNEAKEKPEKAPSILVFLPVKSVGEKVVNDLVDGVKNAPVNIRHLYGQLLFDIDLELILKHREEITPYFPNDYLELYEVLVNGSEEDVWEQYGDILAKLEQEPYIDTNLYQKAKKIAYTLVKKDYITIEELERDFADNLKEEYFDYNGILTVYMFGLMKIDKYLAELADLLIRDEDILSEEVAATLISFQTNEVVEAVKPYIVKEESNIFASSIVENIKTDYAVEVLKDAYHQVDDEDMKATIFEALCHQLSPEGEPEINDYVSDRPSSFLIDIEHVAYSYYKILNMEHPLMDEWKKELQSRDAEEELIFEEPLRNTKVGRNEPCPCGSGKKYKKCCG